MKKILFGFWTPVRLVINVLFCIAIGIAIYFDEKNTCGFVEISVGMAIGFAFSLLYIPLVDKLSKFGDEKATELCVRSTSYINALSIKIDKFGTRLFTRLNTMLRQR